MQKRTVTIDRVKMTWHEAHQDLWNELSQNPGMTKQDYFRTHFVNPIPVRNCFACEYCRINCNKCPIVLWRNDAKIRSKHACAWSIEDGDSKDGLFSLWCDAMSSGNYDEACKTAKQIADLEWEEAEE